MADSYIGEIRMFGFSWPPVNWALCLGQLVPLSQNQALYALYGDIYGGDNQTTVGLPDLQGRVPLHVGGASGRAPGLSYHQIGDRTGTYVASLLTTAMPNHTHTGYTRYATTTDNIQTDAYGFRETDPDNEIFIQPTAVTGTVDMHQDSLSITGGNVPHENRQPFLTVSFCVSQEGQFPSRN